MTWNYRVIHYDTGSNMIGWFAIHTVFYNDQGEIVSYNQVPEYCGGESLEDVHFQTDRMSAACELGALRQSDLDRLVAKQGRRNKLAKPHRNRLLHVSDQTSRHNPK